jgi:Ca2+-transporting ATPase
MKDIIEAVEQDWSTRTCEQTLAGFAVTENGLTSDQHQQRLTEFGINEIARGKPTPWYILLGRQFASPLIYILLLAAIITGYMGHFNDVFIIMAVLIVNSVIGYHQERKAERAINNIKGMSAPTSRVRRDGKIGETEAKNLVPGDIIVLEEGDRVPADARVLSAVRLQVEESIFTGETVAAAKSPEALDQPTGIADKSNMVFMGTHVTAGRAEIIVTSTGMRTELGKIAELVQSADEILTPLQKKIETFSHQVIKAILAICAIIFVSSHLVWKQEFEEVLLNAIAIAVSAIPEGLPVIITLVLAVGVRRMAKHQALIRKLPTVETLGSATVVCTDKTGTLTRNEMVITKICTFRQTFQVPGEGYNPEGNITADEDGKTDELALESLVSTAVLCNNATIKKEDGSWKMIGDATEGAMMTLAGKLRPELLDLREKTPRKAELPFDSKIKFMTTIHEHENGLKAHLKGSFEAVLGRCTHILDGQSVRELTEKDKNRFSEKNHEYASSALRVIAFAECSLDGQTDPEAFVSNEQKGYTFLGIVGMIDLPRPEAVDAVKKCRKAGIRVVMITGDHETTALAVGKQVGLYEEGMESITGAGLAKLSEEELKEKSLKIAVYARTSPEDKMRIIQALQSHGHIVSMTGDGVNDAPALTRADIGVAMGRTGTDVAREAAGMVLVNDNFASIVAAVEEGRIIFNNLRKAIGFLVSTNVGEVLIFLVASLFGLAAPLRAVQILWVNLVTDGTTSIALGVDPAEGDEMERPPRKPDEALLSKPMLTQVAVVSLLMCIGTLYAHKIGNQMGGETLGNSMAFCTVVFFQLFNIFNCRSYEKSLLSVGIFANPSLVGAVFLALALQMAAIYIPFMQNLFGVSALNAQQLLFCVGISFSVIPAVEIAKFLRRKVD